MKATRWNGKKAARVLRTRGRGVGFGVCVGVCAALGASAADVAAPNVTTVGYINGTMNVVVETVAGVSHEIAMKGVSDADYAVVNFKRENFDSNNIKRTCYYLSTNYLGTAAFRIRAVADGVASAWVDCGTHKTTLNVTGTLIGTDGVLNRERSTAVDGRVATFIDGTGDGGNDKWVGYLYDSDVAIKAVRFLPRLDHIALASRYRDSLFQAASDASFSDATNIYQVASNYADLSTITEATFDPPVRARAFRHWKEKGGFEQTAELEFIPAEMPLKPALSIAFTDVTNFYPILSVAFPDRLFCSSFRIERASRKTGPWTPLTETWTDAAAAAPVTDQTELYVGIPVYYRVAAVTQHPDWAGETVYSEPTVYIRARRLERAWTDETKLLDGCSVMKQTNGTVVAASDRAAFVRAFDGNTGTFPDATQAANYNGPVGIDFGQRVWVNGFGYICRNDNACYSRVRCAALHCASGEDPELRDKVVCSANPTRYSQDTTFYYQPGTNCPSDGARCWFLYANRNENDWERFYCNVAELMFFGWTQADLDAAPVLRQPSAPVCVRQGTSVALIWKAVARATSYAVQRRVRGTDVWTTRAADLQTPTYVDDMADVTETAVAFEYRVVADGGELGTEMSDETPFFYYQPGRGTGLRGAAWWPYARTSMAMEQLANVSARGVEAVDLSIPAGTELVPGVTDGVKFVWTGKLICPMTGNYTLTLDADGGGCVRVDGIDTVNDATMAPSGVFTLTAGEHTIRVEYLCTKTTDVRTCRLVWSGPMSEEVVPASQLVPDEEMARPEIDGWDLDVLGQDRCNFTEAMGGGVYKFTAGQMTWTSLTSGNYQFMSQPWTGGFDFSATVKATGYGHIGLMVRDAEGHAYYPYARNEWNITHTGVKAIPSDATNVEELVAPTKISNDVRPVHLRLTRTGPSFTLYTRENAADEWVEKTTWTDAGFARTTWVGLATTGWSGRLFTAEASNIVLKPGRQPLTIILR